VRRYNGAFSGARGGDKARARRVRAAQPLRAR
jgi:hypothetical protein